MNNEINYCVYCGEEILEPEIILNEDAEPVHQCCLDSFIEHWTDRTEMLDLLGY